MKKEWRKAIWLVQKKGGSFAESYFYTWAPGLYPTKKKALPTLRQNKGAALVRAEIVVRVKREKD